MPLPGGSGSSRSKTQACTLPPVRLRQASLGLVAHPLQPDQSVRLYRIYHSQVMLPLRVDVTIVLSSLFTFTSTSGSIYLGYRKNDDS